MGPQSDLDLVVQADSINALMGFAAVLAGLRADLALSFDVEVELSTGQGVKLKEILSQQKTVLAKRIDGIQLLDRQDALHGISLSFEDGKSDRSAAVRSH